MEKEYMYVLLSDSSVLGTVWEDIRIYQDKSEAVKVTEKCSKCRVEVFKKGVDYVYEPTYDYYRDGKLHIGK